MDLKVVLKSGENFTQKIKIYFSTLTRKQLEKNLQENLNEIETNFEKK